jgi:DNA-binding transcriptional LysR family regulator
MGTLRLVVSRPTTTRLLAPLLQPFLAEYPAIRMEIVVDDMHGDIISGRFDAGIHVGRRIDRDMTILRLTEDLEMLTVAAPSYIGGRPAPESPTDLHAHNCIQYRMPWDGSIQPWTFGNGQSQMEIRPRGSLTVNDLDLLLSATLDGIGICHVAEPLAAPYLAQGRLVELLVDWRSTFSGVFLYYPSRRQRPMPLQVFLDFVKKWQKHARRQSVHLNEQIALHAQG